MLKSTLQFIYSYSMQKIDDRSLIWGIDFDKSGLPLDGLAIDRPFVFYFAGLKANIYTK